MSTSIRILAAALLLSMAGTANAGKLRGGGGDNDKDDGNNRREWVKKFDNNKDGNWRGGLFGHKDIRGFKKAHPQPYEKLVKFCNRASESPKKFDVNFPKGEKAKKFKCKKGKVDAPYLKAWIKDAKDDKKEDRDGGSAIRK